MNYWEWNAGAKFWLNFYIHDSEAARPENCLEPLLEIFEQQEGFLRADKVSVGSGRERKYSREAVLKDFSKSSAKKADSLCLLRKTPIYMDQALSWSDKWVRLWLSVFLDPLPFLRQEESHLERAGQLVSLARAIGSRLPIAYGYAHGYVDLGLQEVRYPQSLEGVAPPPFVGWLNVLGREVIEVVGRERVLSVPAHHLEVLPNGTVLFLTRPSLLDFHSEEARVAQARALCHLRPELSLDETLATLLKHSRAFEPLEPAYHPEVAPLLAHLFKAAALASDRRKLMEAYNGFTPPPVSEYLPAAEAPPSDVADVQRAIDIYEGLHAERLVALLCKDTPEVTAQTPEVLPVVDAQVEGKHLPWADEATVEEMLIPMLGAYLGLVLVRHLGGHWVPRQRLEEAQVVVGNKAWLPFLRARHLVEALQSFKTPLYACSLTQLYRVAERSRG